MCRPVYLDHHATTPVDPRVAEAMAPYFAELYGNVASDHCFGRQVRGACTQARQKVAELIGAKANEIIFTSGATESNNLAIKGIAEGLADEGRHVITCVTEHKCVLDCCRYLETKGYEVTYLPVDQYGQVQPRQIEAAIRHGDKGTTQRTILISIMGANNEIGTLHPLVEIGKVAQAAGIVLHVDGAQTVGRVPFDVASCQIDLLSMSGHKIYGPKGVGALYVNRKSDKNLRLAPQMHGGGQENGLRGGTLPVALVVGLGRAAELCGEAMTEENQRLLRLRDKLEQGLKEVVELKVNGHPMERLPGNLNVTLVGINGEQLRCRLKDIAVSSTSACASDSEKPSHVLAAIGRTKDEALASFRFGLGRSTTEEDIDYVLATFVAEIKRQQGVSSHPKIRPPVEAAF